jgi:hypothetical protein
VWVRYVGTVSATVSDSTTDDAHDAVLGASAGVLTLTTVFVQTAVRTSKAPPSFTKLGTLLALLALYAVVARVADYSERRRTPDRHPQPGDYSPSGEQCQV